MLCYVMLCHVMWNLFTVGSLQFPNDSTIASLEANQNRLYVQERKLWAEKTEDASVKDTV